MPGTFETDDLLLFNKALKRVDLPALGLPTITIEDLLILLLFDLTANF